jgi:uncharacterized Tic20 family protein
VTTNPQNPQNPQQPTGAVPPPPAAGYGQPGAVPPAGGYGAPQGGYPPAGYGAPGAPGAPLSDSDQRMWAIFSHVGAILFSFVPPLVIWLAFKGRGALVEHQAKEALNWSITVILAYVALGVLTVVTLFLGIGFGMAIWLVAIAALVFGILAAVAASSGQFYRYPVALRLIK